MDPVLLEKAIIDQKEKTGKSPKAIVPVALYGMPYDCERIMAIADKYGIPVVEATALNDVDNIGQNGWVQHSACARD